MTIILKHAGFFVLFFALTVAAQSSVYVPGYNLSAPEGFGPSGNGSAVDGWQLGVATGEHLPGIINNNTDAAVLWLEAPPGVGRLNATAWKLCATVFPHVDMSAIDEEMPTQGQGQGQGQGADRSNDGNCDPWVTDQCAAGMNEVGVVAGVSDHGDCYDVVAPPSCLPYFRRGQGNGIVISLHQNTHNGRFYAWASLPATMDSAGRKDTTHHVWPVLLTWVQFSPSGMVFAANTQVSCVVAGANGSTTGTSFASSNAVRSLLTRAWLTGALAAATFVLFVCI